MTETRTMELEESNRQFIDAWTLYARRAASGAIAELPGVAVAFSQVAMPLMNMMLLSSPVVDTADLARRVEAAVAYGRGSGVPWILALCEDWLPPSGGAESAQILASASLQPESLIIGMVTAAVAPPRRAAPPLDIREVHGSQERIAVADLNSLSYATPLSWGHEAFDREALFTPDVFSFVGYVDDAPVSTATVMIVEGRLYVTLVATAVAHQRKGYAEAVMRRTLEQATAATGITRTVLHANEAGSSLYRAMGYRAVANFTLYGQAHPPEPRGDALST